MMMARGLTEIDRLIEQGLTLYGEGDLDGALLLWERVLAMDPDNPQATSYVDYVRINYDLLTGDAHTEHSGPFAIGDDEPEYQIEILPGESVAQPLPNAPPPAGPPLAIDANDEGWMISDERGPRRRPLPHELDVPAAEPTFESATTGESVSFEDATREYPGGASWPAKALFDDRGGDQGGDHGGDGPGLEIAEFTPEPTPAFGDPSDVHTPPGFGTEVTETRQRNLGFVHPSEQSDAARRRAAAPGPPELKMTLRTPGSQPLPIPAEADLHRAPTADGGSDEDDERAAPDVRDVRDARGQRAVAAGSDELALDLTPATDARTMDFDAAEVQLPSEPSDDDLIRSLPLPRAPAGPTIPRPTASTRQLPARTRLPAHESSPPVGTGERTFDRGGPHLGAGLGPGLAGDRRDGAPDPHTATTQEMPLGLHLDPLAGLPEPPKPAAPPTALTRDLADIAAGIARGGPPTVEDPLIAAPTIELGLRDRRPPTDEETTREVDTHQVRQVRQAGKARASGTRDVPGVDPIDARGAEILEEVDRSAPTVETREDRTRRRITALLERATEWIRSGDLERAVTSVDLALSEDPNSALAQKLVHRNRDAIMNCFQGFLGDLQRIPQLARPLHELGSAPISPRAAFLLSRVDGTLSLDEILDVSGMPRLEAYRYLCQLFLRSILR